MNEFERRYKIQQRSSRKDKEVNKIIEKYTKLISEISAKPDLAQEDKNEEIKKLKPTIVVDDASHIWSHQINALCEIFPILPHGGIYILEDIHTSYLPYSENFYRDLTINPMDFCKYSKCD